MLRNLRRIAILGLAAPLPILAQPGLSDEAGAVTAAGAAFGFGVAILTGMALSNVIRGLMRIPVLLLALGPAAVILSAGA